MNYSKQSLLLVAALMLGACASNTAGIAVSSQGEMRVDNRSLARHLALQNVDARRVADMIQGSALLVSQSSGDLHLQYKFTWYDANGFTLEDEASSWKAVKLHGKQQLAISAVAPNPETVRFEVYVREAISH
ncbi:MAG: YcfL family protein [Shewanella sp.]